MTPPHLQTHKAGLLKGPFPQVQGKAPTKPSAPETTKRGCSAQYSPHARASTLGCPGRRFRGQRLSLAGTGWLDRAPPARSCRLGSGRPPEGDSLEQLGLEQTLQTVADHGLPEQGLLPVLPWGRMHPQLTPAPPRDARPLIRPPQRARTALALASMVSRKERRPGRGCAGARVVVGLTGGWQGCQPPPSEHGSAWAWRRLTRASRAARPGLGLASEP